MDPMMSGPGEAPSAEPSEGEGAKAVVDAAKAALDVALSDPEFAASFEGTASITLTFSDNGDIDVETDGASTTALASELGASDADDAAAPPMPPPPMAA